MKQEKINDTKELKDIKIIKGVNDFFTSKIEDVQKKEIKLSIKKGDSVLDLEITNREKGLNDENTQYKIVFYENNKKILTQIFPRKSSLLEFLNLNNRNV